MLCLSSAAVEEFAAVSVTENLALIDGEGEEEGSRGDHGKEVDVDEEKGTHQQQQQGGWKDDKREELEDYYEFLRGYEMRRTGVAPI